MHIALPQSLGYKLAANRASDRDAELDQIIEHILASGLTLDQIADRADRAGHAVSPYTLRSWLYGYTQRPHNRTVNAVMAALGYRKVWVPINAARH